MATKTFRKKEIRRAVYGTCLVDAPVGGCSVEAAPIRVTVSVRRRCGCWGRLAGAWREAAAFSFVDRQRAPFLSNAFLDLEHVFRYSSEADAGAAQVKICLTLLSGQTRVAKVGLEDFLGQLMQSGRPECFTLYVYEGKVALLQTRQPSPEVVTEWLFDGRGNDAHKGSTYKDRACYDPEVTVIDNCQEKMDPSDSEESAWETPENDAQESTWETPEEDSDVSAWETPEEDSDVSAWETPEEDSDVSAWETPEEDSDVSAWETPEEDSDVSAWETPEEDSDESKDNSGEESGLDTAEDTDKESGWESDDEDSEERVADEDTEESGGEADDSTEEETRWESEDEDSEEECERETPGDSDESGWETLEEDAEEEAGRGTAGGTEERGGGRSFLARLGAAWRHNRLALLLAAAAVLVSRVPLADPDEWRWGGGGGGL
ncbi:histone-lysine N-methyltransferase SETD1B-like isoform X1 [Eriocheir sinensis]|uniref:histone-lysine N-methyltransferase SETD1B-like isoform X1 n=1 Tax=Eriocheir sinensis TaxID=95602 RepID=UPI0021C8AA36|nr:histone-lysine N-methyltransferase SETD1B-like isoform X1 [Eriocheir sinensis]